MTSATYRETASVVAICRFLQKYVPSFIDERCSVELPAFEAVELEKALDDTESFSSLLEELFYSLLKGLCGKGSKLSRGTWRRFLRRILEEKTSELRFRYSEEMLESWETSVETRVGVLYSLCLWTLEESLPVRKFIQSREFNASMLRGCHVGRDMKGWKYYTFRDPEEVSCRMYKERVKRSGDGGTWEVVCSSADGMEIFANSLNDEKPCERKLRRLCDENVQNARKIEEAQLAKERKLQRSLAKCPMLFRMPEEFHVVGGRKLRKRKEHINFGEQEEEMDKMVEDFIHQAESPLLAPVEEEEESSRIPLLSSQSLEEGYAPISDQIIGSTNENSVDGAHSQPVVLSEDDFYEGNEDDNEEEYKVESEDMSEEDNEGDNEEYKEESEDMSEEDNEGENEDMNEEENKELERTDMNKEESGGNGVNEEMRYLDDDTNSDENSVYIPTDTESSVEDYD